MTHEVLPSDIELARRMLAAKRRESEVVAALLLRKIEPAKASRLVADLKGGRATFPEAASEFVRTAGPPPSSRRNPATSDGPGGVRPGSQESGGGRGEASPTARYATVALSLVAVAGVAVALSGYWRPLLVSTPTPQERPSRVDTSVPSPVVVAARPELFLQAREDGLHIGNTLATRQNALQLLSGLIGPATRTNQLGQYEQTLQAFEHHGLIVYSENGSGPKSIVIDFEGNGGTNGTESPFTGVFQLDDDEINSDTDPIKLAGIKHLRLTNSLASSGIFAGHYRRLGLCFAYQFKKAQRLSILEIDLE
jgi:hypothetical protein